MTLKRCRQEQRNGHYMGVWASLVIWLKSVRFHFEHESEKDKKHKHSYGECSEINSRITGEGSNSRRRRDAVQTRLQWVHSQESRSIPALFSSYTITSAAQVVYICCNVSSTVSNYTDAICSSYWHISVMHSVLGLEVTHPNEAVALIHKEGQDSLCQELLSSSPSEKSQKRNRDVACQQCDGLFLISVTISYLKVTQALLRCSKGEVCIMMCVLPGSWLI